MKRQWVECPPAYLNEWLNNRIVESYSADDGATAFFEDGSALRITLDGGGFWGDDSMTPVPCDIHFWVSPSKRADTIGELTEMWKCWKSQEIMCPRCHQMAAHLYE